MANRLPLTDADGEVRELDAEDLAQFKPAHEVLPPSLLQKLGVRSLRQNPPKERVTLQLSPDILAAFRATGEGWQTRVDAALRDWLKSHSPG